MALTIRLEDILAIVPARAGSKGLHNKNLRRVGGIPLIEWTLDFALKELCASSILITSDCEEIHQIAKNKHCLVIDRPKDLASDTANMLDVIKHALDACGSILTRYSHFALLQPTSPFREQGLLTDAIETMNKKKSNSLIEVKRVDCPHPLKSFLIDNNKCLSPISGDLEPFKNRQDLPDAVFASGRLYICDITRFLVEKTLVIDRCIPITGSKFCNVDIDTMADLQVAERLSQRFAHDQSWKAR